MEQADTKQVSAPEEECNKPRHPSGLPWILWPAVALIIYPLSFGPVAKLEQVFDLEAKHPKLEQALDTCYYPLALLVAKSPAVGRFYLWYTHDIWRVALTS